MLGLPFRADVSRPNRDNAIDVYISDEYEDVIGEDVWAQTFTQRPEPLTPAEKERMAGPLHRRVPWLGCVLPLWR